jgi:hypothetical protein
VLFRHGAEVIGVRRSGHGRGTCRVRALTVRERRYRLRSCAVAQGVPTGVFVRPYRCLCAFQDVGRVTD